MKVDLSGLLVFLAFSIPGFLASKARDSVTPRPLRQIGATAEIGEFILASVCVHVTMLLTYRLFFAFFQREYFFAFVANFRTQELGTFIWNYRHFLFGYFFLSLPVGYLMGFVQGWLILRQPVRSWLVSNRVAGAILQKIGFFGFLQEEPVWYSIFKQTNRDDVVFLEVEMKEQGGFYTGKLRIYGILDDSEKSKDFYLTEAFYKPARHDDYIPLEQGVLLNFGDVLSIRVAKYS